MKKAVSSASTKTKAKKAPSAAASAAAKKPAKKKALATKAAPAKKTIAKKTIAKKTVMKASVTTKTVAKKLVEPPTKTVVRKKKEPAVVAPPTDLTLLRKENSKQLAFAIASAALDKKAERVEIIDIGERVDYTDFLVLMSGRSDRQVVAIAGAIEETFKKLKHKLVGTEGLPQGNWVIIDAVDVIAHVFIEEARQYYDLEGLWMDAPRVRPPAMPVGEPGQN